MEEKRRTRIENGKVLLCFLIPALFCAWFRTAENYDEYWNFTFAKNVADGLLPYRDFNMLQTPLSCFLSGGILALFGKELIVLRLLGVVLFIGIMWVLYRIGRTLQIPPAASMVLPFLFLAFLFWNVFWEYNCLLLFFQITILWRDLEADTDPDRYEKPVYQIFLGILGGLAMMCKQSTGTVLALFSLGSLWFASRRLHKRYGRLAFWRLIGTSIPCFLFLFYLLISGTFWDFLDMAVFSIGTFSHRYSYWRFMRENPIQFAAGALLLSILTAAIAGTISRRKTVQGEKLAGALTMAVAGIVNIYPLSNAYHVGVSSISILLLLYYLIPTSFFSLRAARVLFRILPAVLMAVCMAVPVIAVQIGPPAVLSRHSHYAGIWMEEKREEEIRLVTAEIEKRREEGREVYIMDSFAVAYLLPVDCYHKYLDMFLVGNLGLKDPVECVTDTPPGSLFLLPKDSSHCIQMPWEAYHYIEEHGQRKGEVGDFEIYSLS